MKRSQVLLILLVVVITASLVSRVYFTEDSLYQAETTIPVQTITFWDTNNNSVRFTTGASAVFAGLGFNDINLTPLNTEPSQQYTDQSGRLLITHTDDRIIVTDVGTVLFEGTVSDIPPPIDTTLDGEASLPVASTAPLHRTWVWLGNDLVGEHAAREFSITFLSDNTFFGTTDCNNFNGSYTSTDSEIALTNIASTKMFCPDSYGDLFTTSLNDVSKFTITDYSALALIQPNETLQFTQSLETR